MYTIAKLNYSYDALEPFIDEKTVYIHYEKHHKGYLNKLNKALNDVDYDYRYTIEELINHIDEFPITSRGDILFNAGGVLNHNLYWKNMSPNHHNKPIGTIAQAINEKYGNFENFKEKFIESASKVVGSGWTFLVLNHEGNLEIINTSNQETPYLYGLIPIIALDLWEHSYYLLYQNRRDEYIQNFFNIIDFVEINEIYEKTLQEKNN